MIRHKLGKPRTELTLVMSLFVISLLPRLGMVVPAHFDGLYGQDAFAYYDYAQQLSSSLHKGAALKPFFWPLGYPAILSIALSMGGTTPTIAQAVSILMGAALAPLIYILSRQIGLSRIASIVAAPILTVCGQVLQSSLVIMSDIPALFWATLSAVLLTRYLTRPEKAMRWLILAAITLTLASVTRWIYLVLGLPFGITVLIQWRGHIHWRHALVALCAAALVLLPQFLYSRTNPAPTLNHEWVQGWSAAHAFQSSFTNIDGHFDYAQLNAIYYAQPFFDPYYLSPIFSLILLLGLWTALHRKFWIGIFFGGWALLPYLFLAGIPYQNIRFPLIVMPAIAIFVAQGLDSILDKLRRLQIKTPNRTIIQYLLATLFLIGILHMWKHATEVTTIFIDHQQQDKLAVDWASQHIPYGATVYTFGLTLALRQRTTLDVQELYYETPDTLAAKWQHGKVDYLLLNVWNIENQWVGRDLERSYHWLRDQRGLIKIGKSGYYTLYKVRG